MNYDWYQLDKQFPHRAILSLHMFLQMRFLLNSRLADCDFTVQPPLPNHYLWGRRGVCYYFQEKQELSKEAELFSGLCFIKMLNCICRKLCLRKHVLLSWPVFTYFKINVRDILSLLWNSGISWSTAVKQQLIIKITYRSSVMSNLMQRQLRNLCFCGSLTSIITAKAVLVNFRLHGIMAFYR